MDALGTDSERSSREDDEAVRREILEMEIEEPPTTQSRWGKRISNISQSIQLPTWVKNFKKIRIKWPKIKLSEVDASWAILIARLVAVVVVVGLAWLLFVSDIFTDAATRMGATLYDPERVRIWFMQQIDTAIIRENLEQLSQYDHIAGTEGDFAQSNWIHQQFLESGLENIERDQYDVYLNYPRAGGRGVEILKADGSVQWSAKMEEDEQYPGENRKNAKAFHGHSWGGTVKGPLIYANFGSREDFKRLKEMGVDTTGAIALVRYYGTQGDRALKVKAAELAGFAGCLIYSDPKEDGFLKGKVWPEGRYMPEDGVQRGAVSLMSWVVGDVLTPGWASIASTPRIDKHGAAGLVKIPSLPLSWRDAKPLLQALNGKGKAVPDEWKGGASDIQWFTGDAKSSPVIRLKNEQDEEERQPIWNLMGTITGIEQAEKPIIIGSHRDAWTFGAADPGSGTAILVELARVFGDLKRHNWRPLRTIKFVSWDGEEYNLIGSTEYVEKNIEKLRENGYVYMNVDVAVSGQDFFADASPVFKDALERVLGRVTDPMRNDSSLLDLWRKSGSKLGTLGAGSDYVAFQDIAGVSSIDMGFRSKDPLPVYHSTYDTFEYMETYGDRNFVYHGLMAQVWGLLVLEMADRPILPFSMAHYANEIFVQTKEVEKWTESMAKKASKAQLNFEPLKEAAEAAVRKATAFDMWRLRWDATHTENAAFENGAVQEQRKEHNTRAANFETLLLDLEKGGGLHEREQFKHILFAPQKWSGYDGYVFPAIRDAVDEGDYPRAQKAIDKAADLIQKAAQSLVEGHHGA